MQTLRCWLVHDAWCLCSTLRWNAEPFTDNHGCLHGWIQCGQLCARSQVTSASHAVKCKSLAVSSGSHTMPNILLQIAELQRS